MKPLVIVTGKHTEEGRRRFAALPDCRVVMAERPEDLRPEELAEAEFFAGWISPELVGKMPKLRFVQLFSAGADRYGWLPERITLANAYGAYGDSIAEHMLATTLMAMILTNAGDWNVGFFRKNGYLLRGELKDIPKGHDCYELYKTL